MRFHLLGRLVGALALAGCLGACVDVTMDVKVRNEAEAQGTMTTTVASQFYPMIKASKTGNTNAASSDNDGFCPEKDGGALVENPDGSATCTVTKEGKFADLAFDNGKEQVNFTSAGPGLVRVAFPTAELSSGINAAANGNNGGAAEDPQTKQTQDQMKQAMAAYFAGHFLTLRIEGGEITDST